MIDSIYVTLGQEQIKERPYEHKKGFQGFRYKYE